MSEKNDIRFWVIRRPVIYGNWKVMAWKPTYWDTFYSNMKWKSLNLANLGMWGKKKAKRAVENKENVSPRVNTEYMIDSLANPDSSGPQEVQGIFQHFTWGPCKSWGQNGNGFLPIGQHHKWWARHCACPQCTGHGCESTATSARCTVSAAKQSQNSNLLSNGTVMDAENWLPVVVQSKRPICWWPWTWGCCEVSAGSLYTCMEKVKGKMCTWKSKDLEAICTLPQQHECHTVVWFHDESTLYAHDWHKAR